MTNAGYQPGSAAPRAGSRSRRVVGAVVGLLLFGGAIAAIAYSGRTTLDGLDRLASAPWPFLVLLLVLPLANLMLTSLCFQALTRRFAHVEPHEMHALIAGSFLLNFLPLRPGLFGRMAYHTRVHGMRVRDVARVLIESIACAGVAMLILLAALAMARVLPVTAAAFLGGSTLAITMLWMHARDSGNMALRSYALATLIKLADILLWGARYVVLFGLMGRPILAREGISLAVVANAASLVPLAGNGLGLREWAVGIVAASLPGHATGSMVVEVGLSADLANRGAEIIVAIVTGLPALAWLSRRLSRVPTDPASRR